MFNKRCRLFSIKEPQTARIKRLKIKETDFDAFSGKAQESLQLARYLQVGTSDHLFLFFKEYYSLQEIDV